MFRGSALTFGGLIYHGDAPFQRYTLNAGNTGPGFLYASRGTTSANVALDQSRTADYQAFFIEDLIRIGKFHIVPSFRLDHESVEVDATVAPYFRPGTSPNRDADKLIPLWGIGLGNDFAGNNETYFSASSGWRPVRFFDIAGTRTAVSPGQSPDPFRSLDIELGVHGTPIKGLWYDVGLFWLQFDNRIETRADTSPGAGPFDTIAVNTGSTRHRGFEGEISYDFLAPFQDDLVPASAPVDPQVLRQTNGRAGRARPSAPADRVQQPPAARRRIHRQHPNRRGHRAALSATNPPTHPTSSSKAESPSSATSVSTSRSPASTFPSNSGRTPTSGAPAFRRPRFPPTKCSTSPENSTSPATSASSAASPTWRIRNTIPASFPSAVAASIPPRVAVVTPASPSSFSDFRSGVGSPRRSAPACSTISCAGRQKRRPTRPPYAIGQRGNRSRMRSLPHR